MGLDECGASGYSIRVLLSLNFISGKNKWVAHKMTFGEFEHGH